MTQRRIVTPLLIVILAVVFLVLPYLTKREDILNLGFLVLLNICLGQSWNILAGLTGQSSLGHAAFFGIGALATRWFWASGGVPIPLALLLGAVASAAFAMIIGVPTFRLRGAYFAIGTLALGEMMHAVVSQVFPYIDSMPAEQIAQYSLTTRYYFALACVVIMIGTTALLMRLPIGLGLQAVREDEDAARANGLNPLPHKLFALALSSLFAGLTGGLFAYHQVSYYPQAVFGANWTFEATLIAYVGGFGTLFGPVIGSLFFVALRELLASAFAQLSLVIFGVLFIVVVLVFPGGLIELGSRIRRLGMGK
jgi:branched-chain amino acid transport system permease protein